MKILRFVALLCFSIALAGDLHSQDSKTQFNIENGLAIEGYDPVAYFAAGKPLQGKKELVVRVGDVSYRFFSSANREVFLKDPAKYQPQYGGWCAYAMGANGEKVEVDPETFKVVDNKLYLFYNAYFNNTLKKWNEDEVSLKKKADVNWNKLIK